MIHWVSLGERAKKNLTVQRRGSGHSYTNDMDSLMNSIDNIKVKITDAEYKELCDKMQDLFKRKDEGFYRVWYIETKVDYEGDRDKYVGDDDDDDDEKPNMITTYYYTRVRNTIVRMASDKAASFIERIRDSGFIYVGSELLKVEPPRPLHVVHEGEVKQSLSNGSSCITVVRIELA